MKKPVIIATILLSLYFLLKSKYSIVVKTLPGKIITYTMQVGDKKVDGSYTLGEPAKITEAGDGIHYFVIFGNTATGMVSLAISIKSDDGGYLAKKETLVSLT
jgi:hypothetical protein